MGNLYQCNLCNLCLYVFQVRREIEERFHEEESRRLREKEAQRQREAQEQERKRKEKEEKMLAREAPRFETEVRKKVRAYQAQRVDPRRPTVSRSVEAKPGTRAS